MRGFEYPTKPHLRRHGPGGYQDYESYRDWLRDEFLFRCIYCLHRERWYGRGATFNIDHFAPVAANPKGKLEYTNLLYACATCNNAKRQLLNLPDPCSVALSDCLRIRSDGNLEALNRDGELLVKKLRLNNDNNVEWRFRWMRTLAFLELHNPELFREYMAFPDDLPDLRTKRVPNNTTPQSVDDCYSAQRERGKLPETY